MPHHTPQCFTSLLIGGLILTGCASGPDSVSHEMLDAHTGTTLSRLEKPVQLLSEEARGASADPFAYFGPFQTNRMGAYALYLWVAVPAPENAEIGAPEIRCDAQPLTLKPVEGSMADLGLSAPPYAAPAPWSRISYYVLTSEDLGCLQHASQATLTLDLGKPTEEHFLAPHDALSGVAGFTTDVASAPPK